jgi:hypothetical protein
MISIIKKTHIKNKPNHDKQSTKHRGRFFIVDACVHNSVI